MNYIIFLQNAWSPLYAERRWPRDSWLRALATSRTGTRLKLMIDDLDLCENTTPIVGATPGSIIPPDLTHIIEVIVRRKPDLIVTCGKQAAVAIKDCWAGPMLIVPHPAHRLLTNNLYVEARKILTREVPGRIRMEQKRGAVLTSLLL